jgi:hypothetical protein
VRFDVAPDIAGGAAQGRYAGDWFSPREGDVESPSRAASAATDRDDRIAIFSCGVIGREPAAARKPQFPIDVRESGRPIRVGVGLSLGTADEE